MPVGIYVPVYQGFPDHRKTVRAAALLQADQFKVAMHIVVLWLWALTNADEDGRVDGSTAAELAMAARWTGPASEFEEALVLVGYLDRIPGGHVIHDWDETGGKVLRELKRERDRSRQRRSGTGERPTVRPSRRPPAQGGQAGGRSGGATAVGPAVGPAVRGVERREDVKDSLVGSTDRRAPSYPEWFEAWWKLYTKCSGRGRNKAGTYTLAERLPFEVRQDLARLTAVHAAHREAAARAGQFVPAWSDPERYIRKRGWEDEYVLDGEAAAGAAPEAPDDTTLLIREELQHREHPRWTEYERAVVRRETPVGWDEWLAQRSAS